MTAILWTPPAQDDLQAVYDYIANESPHYADIVVDRILQAVARIDRFPESGRIVPELNRRDIREIIWRSYRIVYRLMQSGAQAHVLTVFRSERLLALRPDLGGPA